MHVAGDLETDSLDVPAMLAVAAGMTETKGSSRGTWGWSSDQFAPRLINLFSGDVALKAHRVALTPALGARELKTKLHFGTDDIAAHDMNAAFAGGRLAGNIDVRKGGDGLQTQGKLVVSGADATRLIGGGARPALSGALSGEMSFEGSGLSPVALVGSLHGSGKVALENAQLAGLDPRAFDSVTRAVDAGLPIESARISNVVGKALASGQLKVRHAEGDLAMAAGQIRLDKVSAASNDAGLSVSGALDLTDGIMDAHLVLSGAGEAAGTRPDIYMALKGPLGAPERSIDVSALTGWLTLRSVENQARKLKSLEEAAARERAAREKADEERAEKLRAEQERRARERAARARPATTPTIQPKTFPPVSPPLVITAPPASVSRNESAAAAPSNRTGELPPAAAAPAFDAAPTLPPPVTIDRLPGSIIPTHP
jgi:large subunit ribosomal protein L24